MAGNFVSASSQFIDLTTHVASLETANGWLSMWFKTSTQSDVTIGRGDNTAANFGEMDIGDSTGTFADESIRWLIINSSVPYIDAFVRDGHAAYTDGAWHHIVVAMNGTANKIYVDSVDKVLSFLSGGLTTSNAFLTADIMSNIAFGKRFRVASELFWNGQLDDIRIYTGTPTQAQVNILFHSRGNDGIVANRVARYLMNEGPSGSTIVTPIDIGGGGFNGSPSGSPTYIESPIRLLR